MKHSLSTIKTWIAIISILTCMSALGFMLGCKASKSITEVNSPKPVISENLSQKRIERRKKHGKEFKVRKHILVPGNAYKIRKPKA